MKVHHIMTRDPVTLRPSDSLLDAIKTFLLHNVSGCPVVSRGKLVGVITQSDVIRAIDVHAKIHKAMDALPLIMAAIKSENYENLKPAIRQFLKNEISKYCTKKPVSIKADEDIYHAAKLINRHNVDRLPVIDRGKLVGIVSKIDILRAMA